MQNRIKELREEKKMTKLRLSMELGVTKETVSAYEIGKHYPSVKSLLKMWELFHASLDYIMELSDICQTIKKDGLPQDEAALISLYRNFESNTERKRNRVYAGYVGII